MDYGICDLSIVPLRSKPSDSSELVSQVLFGEDFVILEKDRNWSKIRLSFDQYEGYIDNKQYLRIDRSTFIKLSKSQCYYCSETVSLINSSRRQSQIITIGSRLPFYKNHSFSIGKNKFSYKGNVCQGKFRKEKIIHKAFQLLNTPYLWGGKSPFGIDCSGFTQLVYKLCGHSLLRDAKDQATQGITINSIEGSESGDLAFFSNEKDTITHVGIIVNNRELIHAHGKIKVDSLDDIGIYNRELKTYTHGLRSIKKIF